jgi:hypothetical protein
VTPDGGKANHLTTLLVCLAIVAAIFAASIGLSVLYVESNRTQAGE